MTHIEVTEPDKNNNV